MTRTEWCDNSSKQASGINREIPRCFDGRPTFAVCTVFNHAESELLFLCDDCRDAVHDARRKFGMEVNTRLLPKANQVSRYD